MKKLVTVSLVAVLLLVLAVSASASSKGKGKYITEERIVQQRETEYVAEFGEIESPQGWKVEEKSLDGLKYKIKFKNFFMGEKVFEGELKAEAAEQTKEHTWGTGNMKVKAIVKFDVKEVEVKPEIKKLFYIGYETNGCKVMFNNKLSITDKKHIDKYKPFIKNKSKVYKRGVWLYTKKDWVCVVPEVTPPATEETPPVTEPTPPVTEPTLPATEVTEPVVTETVVNSQKELPKTGESSPLPLILIGVTLLAIGGIGIRYAYVQINK